MKKNELTPTSTSTRRPRPFSSKKTNSDWIDSPFTGQGSPPPNTETTVFMSVYLNKLIKVEEQDYTFSVLFYTYLSWRDPRAYSAVQAATARMNEKSSVGDGGAGCDRPCSGQEMRSEITKCCDTLWLPTLIFRCVRFFFFFFSVDFLFFVFRSPFSFRSLSFFPPQSHSSFLIAKQNKNKRTTAIFKRLSKGAYNRECISDCLFRFYHIFFPASNKNKTKSKNKNKNKKRIADITSRFARTAL